MSDKNKDLSAEELESVAGGSADINEKEKYRQPAHAEGRTIVVEVSAALSYRKHYICKKCHAEDSTYAREKCDINNGLDEFRDCKCYECNELVGNINTQGFPAS